MATIEDTKELAKIVTIGDTFRVGVKLYRVTSTAFAESQCGPDELTARLRVEAEYVGLCDSPGSTQGEERS